MLDPTAVSWSINCFLSQVVQAASTFLTNLACREQNPRLSKQTDAKMFLSFGSLVCSTAAGCRSGRVGKRTPLRPATNGEGPFPEQNRGLMRTPLAMTATPSSSARSRRKQSVTSDMPTAACVSHNLKRAVWKTLGGHLGKNHKTDHKKSSAIDYSSFSKQKHSDSAPGPQGDSKLTCFQKLLAPVNVSPV